jgi:peptide/nickel transport system substrate-binding protein
MPGQKRKKIEILSVLLIAAFILTACRTAGQPTQPASAPTQAAEPTPTAIPQKTLIICLAQEPDSLYLYGKSTRAMWNVLEAIYDGPIDTINYQAQPVILNDLPTLENGGVSLSTVPVSVGDRVANVDGDVVALAKGVRVFAEGCTSPDCAVTWDGTSPLNLTQMTARFTLLEGLKWSNGEPLTAADSVFSYTVSANPATDVSKVNIDRTQSYEQKGGTTIAWTGIPGYLTLNPASFFWSPLPERQLTEVPIADLSTSELTTRSPLGWGPYQVQEWIPGESIRLVKNPNYFRAAEGLPVFDVLVYRFLNDFPETDISQAATGECDIIDSSSGLEDQITTIREMEEQGLIKGYFTSGPEWEVLNFGISPASYDDIYNPWLDRQNFFGDLRTRQAISYCIDREKLVSKVLYSQSIVPGTSLPPNHPVAANLSALPYDPELGKKLLDEVGWVDTDGDPLTPRVSRGIADIMEGTEFILNYYLTESELHTRVSDIVIDSLGQCGVKVNRTFLGVEEMFKTGENAPVFGRNFDLAEMAWSTGRQPPCFLFSSSEIPTAENSWLGTKFGGVNLSGFSNEEYDQACANLQSTGLNADLLRSNALRYQEILATELPVLPLFYHIKAMVSRPDLCGLILDSSSRSPFRLLEILDFADSCQVE